MDADVNGLRPPALMMVGMGGVRAAMPSYDEDFVQRLKDGLFTLTRTYGSRGQRLRHAQHWTDGTPVALARLAMLWLALS